ncbi:MAG: FecR domain-containing protein [Alkalispirochaeta sp.]
MKRFISALVVILTVTTVLGAQQNPIAILEYFEDERELTISDENGFEVNYYIGMGLSPGDRVRTGATTVEIRLDPNGSIIKIAADTDFRLDSLQNRDGAPANRVSVARGRVRMIAARLSDERPRYEIATPGGVAGVRGTDFGVHVVHAAPEGTGAAGTQEAAETPPEDEAEAPEEGAPPGQTAEDQVVPAPPTQMEELFVFDGEVIFTNRNTEEAVFVGPGQRVDLRGAEFLPEEMDAAAIARRQEGLQFDHLDPTAVPGITPEVEPEVVDVEPAPVEEVPREPEEEDAPGLVDRVFGRIAEISALGIGSITINEETYAQAVFQPQISVGKLDLALYLPVTYREDLFDPTDWYQPEGNNEWSFSSDQDWSKEPLVALRDLGTDIALKIRYLEYAERGDPFFLKIGNLSTFTIGQGLLMRNYANDVDFPVVRRIGFNTGLDREAWGFEAMVNDLAAPEIYGGRLFFRPAASVIPAAVGLSAITDIDPADEISLDDTNGDSIDSTKTALFEAAQTGYPLFLNVGIDVELPVIERDLFNLVAFGETGGLIPYLREDTQLGEEGINSGLKTSALVDFSSGDLKNFGWTAGVRGSALIVDYRLQFLSYDGIFRPAFYGPSYDRLRGNYAAETIAYLAATEAEEYQVQTLGVAGEAGADILELVYISAGYLWPWEQEEGGDWRGSNDDELTVSLALRDGLIPFGITAGAEYRRTHFAATVAGWNEFDDAHLFDAYTTLDGYVRGPLSEIIDLEARISTAVVRNDEGEVVYDDNGSPQVAPVLAIQTRIGF